MGKLNKNQVVELMNKARLAKGCSKETRNKMRLAKLGSKNHNWKGIEHKRKHRYLLIYDPNHFSHEFGNYVAEHRYVVEKILNRPLKTNEIVHHINGNNHDNKVQNLMVLNNNSAHKRMDWGSKVETHEIIFDGRNY